MARSPGVESVSVTGFVGGGGGGGGGIAVGRGRSGGGAVIEGDHAEGLREGVEMQENKFLVAGAHHIDPGRGKSGRELLRDFPAGADGAIAVDAEGGQEPVWMHGQPLFFERVEALHACETNGISAEEGVKAVGGEGLVSDQVAV